MTHVWVVHGVARDVHRNRLQYQGVSPIRHLVRYLASAPPMVSLADALAGRGSAFTVDDATRGSADAALLARKHGHQVTLFVNPYFVETGKPYSFLLLGTLLDAVRRPRCEFNGTSFATARPADRLALRRTLKDALCAIRDEPARLSLVHALAAEWGCASLRPAHHLRTLRKDELIELRTLGVDLQNHGWSHSPHGILSTDESEREVREGREWLRRELGADAGYFAVPFGDVLPTPRALAACTVWLTMDFDRPGGALAPGVYNRAMPGFAANRERGTPGWKGRLRLLLPGRRK